MQGVLLGFLSLRDLSMYEIKGAVQKSVGFFYTASFGSLHPALKKLEKEGFVRAKKKSGARGKITYSITAAGRRAHETWLRSEIPLGRLQDEGLLRLFFMASIPARDRAIVLRDYIEKIDRQAQSLRAIESQAREREIPAAMRPAYNHQMLTLEFGLKYAQFERDWYLSVLKRMQAGELDAGGKK